MSVEDSESRRFGLNIRLSFSEADLGSTSAQNFFFRRVSKVGTFRLKNRAHSKLCLNYSDVYLWNPNFFGKFCVSVGTGPSTAVHMKNTAGCRFTMTDGSCKQQQSHHNISIDIDAAAAEAAARCILTALQQSHAYAHTWYHGTWCWHVRMYSSYCE